MHVAVLGPVRLVRGEEEVELGTPKQRGLLAALALHAGRPVPADALVEVLWGDAAPAAVTSSLQAYVAGLRRALEPGRAARAPATVLVTSPAGYTLNLTTAALDVARFADTVERVRRRLLLPPGELPLPPTGLPGTELAALETELREALRLWSGVPYADLRDADDVVAERARLAELRLVALEDLALLRLAQGEHAAVAAELDGLTREHPLREPLWALQVLALAGAGRQADALAALRRARGLLADELGVDPGPALQALETAVLRQDPRLQRVAAPAAVVPAPRAPEAAAPVRRGRIVGRRAELAALEAVLASAEGGVPASALLVGEPGIGKSRLLQEVGDTAAARGFAVLTGRCSQDEGAPPLWPWTGVLRDLHAALPLDDVAEPVQRLLDGGGAPGGTDHARFQLGEAVVQVLAAAARRQPLLVLLDDLHWADASSLRLLAQVVEDLADARVAVVATRRPSPTPTGALAEVGEVLVRAGARRLELTGLSTEEVAELVAATSDGRADPAEAAALRARTEGNALFVVELVRLGQGATAAAVPSAVTDVVAARVAQLPADSRDVLQTASVLGRSFDLDLLTAVAGTDEDAVLDALEPALEAGIVLEAGVGAFRFSHALVADAVSQQVTATRRARRHAAAAAALAAGRGTAGSERLAETARHWLAAGPASSRRAWQAAAAAAEQAVALYAHEEAAALLAAALDALSRDPEGTPAERYALLLARADACRWCADRDGQTAAQREAVLAARELDDVEALVRAATDGVEGVLWTARPFGVVEPVVVDALHEALDRLPGEDSPLRCRTLLALSAELYYADGVEEREALAEEGLAMARRLGDPALLRWAAQAASQALWRPARLHRRLELGEEAVALALAGGEVTDEVFARASRAIALHEAGRIDEMTAEAHRARELAEQARLSDATVILGLLEVPWLALRGRFDDARALLERTEALARRTSMPDVDPGLAGALFSVMLAEGRSAEAAPLIEALSALTPMPMHTPYVAVLCRAGRLDDARAAYEAGGLPRGGDDWLRLLLSALAAECALHLGLPDEAARAYAELAPSAGCSACGGSSAPVGPVDLFLACAAAATGERALATRHADDALALCAQWSSPVLTDLVVDLRTRYGF